MRRFWRLLWIALLAQTTESVQFMGVRAELVPIAPCDGLLQRFKTWFLKLDDLTALNAHEVIMVRLGKRHFIIGRTVEEIVFFNSAGVMKQQQGSIDGAAGDGRID